MVCNKIIQSQYDNLENLKRMGFFEKEKDKPTEIVIKPDQLDFTKIKEYEHSKTKKFEFRPQTWEQFIGQKEAKERAKTIIKKAKRGLKCHFLVDGIKGHGKTTYVELLAKYLDAHLISRVGKEINIDNLIPILNEIHDAKKEFVVLFVDEMDTMDKKLIKVLNPIIESFKISGKNLRPFIFAGATINKHILLKNNPDTLDRIPTHIKFQRYSDEQIKQILSQYINQLYKNENINEKDIDIISKNCKYNPRTSIALLEEYIVEQDIKKVLKNCNIIKDGLTINDIKILKILNEFKKAIGANALAMKVGLSQEEYLREFEPYLIEKNYINRVPSRIITEKGEELLRNIK